MFLDHLGGVLHVHRVEAGLHDHDQPGVGAGQHAVRTLEDGIDRLRASDDDADHVCMGRYFPRRFSRLGTQLY